MVSTASITNATLSLSLDDAGDPPVSVLRIPVHQVNPHLVCGLCQGYLYEACTITECMHSFCKSCLVKHLQRSLNCPMCAILIHPTDPFVHIRLDGLLQDIVYALLPQVEKAESEKERLFYEKNGGYRREKSRNQHASSRSAPQLHRPSRPKGEDDQPSETNVPRLSFPSQHPPVALYLTPLNPSKLQNLEKPFVWVKGGATMQNVAHFLKKKLLLPDSQRINFFCSQNTGLVYLSTDHTVKGVKDLYYYNQNMVLLKYGIPGI